MRPFVFLLAFSLLAQSRREAFHTVGDVEAGARLFRANCAVCHGPDGAALPTADLRRGQFRRGSTDEDLMRTISNGVPGTPMPPISFTGAQLWQVVAYLRTLGSSAAAGGDAGRGQALLEGRGQCLSCHRLDGRGARVGPDLSDIGALRSPDYLRRSLLRPDDQVLPQHRAVRAVTREGRAISGRRLNDDTHTLQVLDPQGRLVSLDKSDLQRYEILTGSLMPSFEGRLNPQELSDLVSYLVSRKGP